MDNTTRSTSPFPPSSTGSSTGSTGSSGSASGSAPESNKWSEQPHAADSLSSGASPLHAGSPDNETLDRVVKGAHDTVDRLAETAAPHVQRLQDSAEELRHTGDEWSESLRSTVRANPLASVATALAVGVVLAKLTS